MLYTSVMVTPAPVRVPTQQLRVLSFTLAVGLLAYVVRLIKSRRLRWTGLVARMEILTGKPTGNRH
jgi:hypothetical protein